MRSPRLPVRSQHLRLAAEALSDGRVPWLARLGLKTLATPLMPWLDRPLGGPILANLVVTYRCNHVCFMCDLPKTSFQRPRGSEELRTDELRRVIDDLLELGVAGVNFTGGEPTLRDDLVELMAHAKRGGAIVNLSTNAFRLADRARVEAIVEAGVDAINVSLDGARAATHDRLRGVPGAFERVARATEHLLEARARRGSRKPSLTYLFVIGPENHGEALDYVALARARGVDAASFMPLFGVYDGASAPDESTRAAMLATVEAIRREKRGPGGAILDNSDGYLSLFEASFRAQPSPIRCYAPYQHVAIDPFGNVYACALRFHQGPASGNVRERPIGELWRSEAYQATRRELADCRACLWNCHTEMNLLYSAGPA